MKVIRIMAVAAAVTVVMLLTFRRSPPGELADDEPDWNEVAPELRDYAKRAWAAESLFRDEEQALLDLLERDSGPEAMRAIDALVQILLVRAAAVRQAGDGHMPTETLAERQEALADAYEAFAECLRYPVPNETRIDAIRQMVSSSAAMAADLGLSRMPGMVAGDDD